MKVTQRETVTVRLTTEELADMLWCNRTIDFDPKGCSFVVWTDSDRNIALEIRRW